MQFVNDNIREHIKERLFAIKDVVEDSPAFVNTGKFGARNVVEASQKNAFDKSCIIVSELYDNLNAKEQEMLDDYVLRVIEVWCKEDAREKTIFEDTTFPAVVRSKGSKQVKSEFPIKHAQLALTDYGLNACFREGILDKDNYKNGYLSSVVDKVFENHLDVDPKDVDDDDVFMYKSEIVMSDDKQPKSVTLRRGSVSLELMCTPIKSPVTGNKEKPLPENFYQMGITFSASMTDRYFNEALKHTPFHLPTEYVCRLYVIQKLLIKSETKSGRFYNNDELYVNLRDLGAFELITGLCYLAFEWCVTKNMGVAGESEKFIGVSSLLNGWMTEAKVVRVPQFIRSWSIKARKVKFDYLKPSDIGYALPDPPGIAQASLEKLANQEIEGAEKVLQTNIPFVQTRTTVLLQDSAFTTHCFHRAFACLTTSFYTAGMSDLEGFNVFYECALSSIGRNINRYGKGCDKVINKLQRLMMSITRTEVPDGADIPSGIAGQVLPFQPNLKFHTCYDMYAEIFLAHSLKIKHKHLQEAVSTEFDIKTHSSERVKIVDAIKGIDPDRLMDRAVDVIFNLYDPSIDDNIEKMTTCYANNTAIRLYTALSRVSMIGGFKQMDDVLYGGFGDDHRRVVFERDPFQMSERFKEYGVAELKKNMQTILAPSIDDLIQFSKLSIKSASGGGDSVTIPKVNLRDTLKDDRLTGGKKDETSVSQNKKLIIPALVPMMLRRFDEETYNMNRMSTPIQPFTEGKRRVPARDTRSVKVVPTGFQLLLYAVYNSFKRFQSQDTSRHYMLAHNDGAICENIRDFLRQSLNMCKARTKLSAPEDYKAMDNFESHMWWMLHIIALSQVTITENDEFTGVFGSSYREVLTNVLESFTDSYYIYKPTGCPSQVVMISSMPSGVILTAPDNTTFTNAHLTMVAERVLPPSVTMSFKAAWGDDCTMVLDLPPSMTFEQAIELLDSIADSAKECGQVWDSYDGVGPGQFIDILKTFYLMGQTFKRFMPYDSEHPVVLTTPGDISPILTNVVDMAVRGFNSRSLNLMIITLVIMGRTDSVFGYSFTFNFFDMLMPGGLCGIMPIGFPQAASTNYMKLTYHEIFPDAMIVNRPRMDASHELGLRMLNGAATVKTKIGGIQSEPATDQMLRGANNYYLDRERIFHPKDTIEKDLYSKYQKHELSRSSAHEDAADTLENSYYKNSVKNQLAGGLGEALISSHLNAKFMQANLRKLNLISDNPLSEVVKPDRFPMMKNAPMKYGMYNVEFFLNDRRSEVCYEMAVPLTNEGHFNLCKSVGVDVIRNTLISFKRCYSPFLGMPKVYNVIIGMLGLQFSTNSLAKSNNLGQFDSSFRRDHIAAEQVVEKLNRTPIEFEFVMLKSLGFLEDEANKLIKLKRDGRLDVIVDKIKFTEYSSNPDVLKSVSTSRVNEIFNHILSEDPQTRMYLQSENDGLSKNIMSYYVSLLYDQMSVACELSPAALSNHLYVTLPSFRITIA